MSGYDDNSTEFSDLERRADTSIRHPVKSRIIYNATLEATSVGLRVDKYYDVHGNKIHGRVSLQPFESKILIAADYEVSAPALR